MTPLTNRTTPNFLAFSLALSMLVGLSACTNKDTPKVASQVAAKVGSEEISVHQINLVLANRNASGASPEELKAMGRNALENLINQQLAVDQALEGKLNRLPEVVAQIEASKRDVLANAYLKQFVSGLSKPSAEETKEYYGEHPQLFSERRIFNLQEVVTAFTPEVSTQLHSMAASNKPIEEVAAWLKTNNVKFTGGSASRTAEQIPLEMLPTVHALKDGQDAVIVSPASVTLVRLVSSKSSPVNEAMALPRIAQYLSNQRTNEAIAAHMKQLRANTKIAYVGEYATPEPAAAAAEQTTLAPANTANPTARSALEKGVAGMK